MQNYENDPTRMREEKHFRAINNNIIKRRWYDRAPIKNNAQKKSLRTASTTHRDIL